MDQLSANIQFQKIISNSSTFYPNLDPSIFFFLISGSGKDDDFYSSLAAMAENGEDSDVSEADVNTLAKSIAVS